jgi:hypothetical protein
MKKNPVDLTLRNLRASLKRVDRLQHQLSLQKELLLTLRGSLKATAYRVSVLESRVGRLVG